MSSLRVFFVGGLTSYRALFHWMNPWIFVPMLVVLPVGQLLFFAYLGRASHVRDDTFFVIGNSLVAAALPGLFGMAHSISGDRRSQTLAALLASPASRIPLFLGRTLPAIANGFLVSAFCFATGTLLLRFHLDGSRIPAVALVTAICAFSCAALGVCIGAVGLRVRNVSVLADMLFGLFLVVVGVNVPIDRLPDAVRFVSSGLPLNHGIEAARALAGGAGLGDVRSLLATELAIGIAYLVAGLVLLRLFEFEGRHSGALETF
jgi:ABC-2 type transport system permease protein